MRIPLPVSVSIRAFAIVALMFSVLASGPTGSREVAADSTSFNLALNVGLLQALAEPVLDPLSDPPGTFKAVRAGQFDPARTNLVQGAWLSAIGCPTKGFFAPYNPVTNSAGPDQPYTDTACLTGDANDQRNMGLLLVKTGPTENFAAATAELTNVKGMTISELGYDIRKAGASGASPLGSHCGAGAPRFDIVTTDGVVHFLGCNSPPGVVAATSTGWVRLRWGAAELATAFPPLLPGNTVRRIVIIFDEGTDASGGPDSFGAAILDNIDVNGTLVGHGDVNAS
jgi:hypothetical protein